MKVNDLAVKAFQDVDEDLDLVLIPSSITSSPPFSFTDVAADFSAEAKCLEAEDHFVDDDGCHWTRQGDKVYREMALVVPTTALDKFIKELHFKLGHVNRQWLWRFFCERFYCKEMRQAKLKIEQVCTHCPICVRANTNTPKDRGAPGHLDVPQVANQEWAIDFVHIESSKKSEGLTHIFFIVETLTGFIQAAAMKSSADEAALCMELWNSISRFGAPCRITAENDIRWNSTKGPWRKMLESLGVEFHMTTPYKADSNGRCERHVREIIKIMRAVKAELNVEWTEGLPLVVALLNSRPRSPSGFSAAELYLGRSQWPLLRQDLDCRFVHKKVSEIAVLIDRLFRERNSRRSKALRRPASVIRPGMYVFVHQSRFPSHASKCSKLGLPWLGPFLVTAIQPDGRVAVVLVNNNEVRVDLSRVKRSPFSPSDAEFIGDEEIVEMTEEEMAAEGLYVPESIIGHELRDGQYWFKTLWTGYGIEDFTWEPLANFVNRKRQEAAAIINEVFVEYCNSSGLAAALAQANALAECHKLVAVQRS